MLLSQLSCEGTTLVEASTEIRKQLSSFDGTI